MKRILIAIYAVGLVSAGAVADGSRQAAKPIIPEGWEGVYESMGFAPALRVGDTIYVSGLIARLRGEGTYAERYASGLRSLFVTLEKILTKEGATLDDVVELTSFHTDLPRQLETILAVRKEMMPGLPHPAWTAVGTTALASPDGQTEIKFTVKLRK